MEDSDFVSLNKIELVIHSPLQRAKETSETLLGVSSDQAIDIALTETTTTQDESAESSKSRPASVKRVLNLSILEEKTHSEWVWSQSSYEQRVNSFQKWLGAQPESVICIVGHSQYFKTMLGLPFKFDNVDVYGVSFDPQKTTANEPFVLENAGVPETVTMKPEWYDIQLLHTCRDQKPPTTN